MIPRCGVSVQTYGRGLEGLVVGETRISRIDGEAGRLEYRGIPVEDLAGIHPFEEVVFLLLTGGLPTTEEGIGWREQLAVHGEPPQESVAVVTALGGRVPLLDAFRTAWAAVSCAEESGAGDFPGAVARILAWSCSLAGRLHRQTRGGPFDAPASTGRFAADFLRLAFGESPSDEAIRAFDASLVVQAEHGIHAAALAALSVASARADLEGAVLAGIAALSGPLHGGANRAAFRMVRGLDGPEAARTWAAEALERKERFPGFGHRVYKAPDPRVLALESMTRELLSARGEARLWETFCALRETVEECLGPRGIFANVDAITGLLYHAIGLDEEAFTLPFCLAIQAGWMAHIQEYLPAGRVFQPRSVYRVGGR